MLQARSILTIAILAPFLTGGGIIFVVPPTVTPSAVTQGLSIREDGSHARTLPPGGEPASSASEGVYHSVHGGSAQFSGSVYPFHFPRNPSLFRSQLSHPLSGPIINGTFGFSGAAFNRWDPPDGGIASGNGFLMEMVNAEFMTWTTSGTYISKASLSQFWNSTDKFTDPAILYDDNHGRWITLCIDLTTSLWVMAVSHTADPTGGWWLWTLRNPGAGFPDQPFIGIDSNTFVVTGNDGGSIFDSEFLNLSDIENGNPKPTLELFHPNSSYYADRPARTYGPSSTIYLAGDNGGNGYANLDLFVITGSPPATVTMTHHSLSTKTSLVPAGTQPGGTVNSGDGRVSGVAERNGTLWVSANDGCASSTVTCLHLWQVNLSALKLTQDFTWTPTGSAINTELPAVAIDAAGDLGVISTYSSATLYPGVLITGQSTTDPRGTLEGPLYVKPGTGSYVGSFNRFGDYNAIDVEEGTGGMTFWGEAEWVGADSATVLWHTWIQSYSFGSLVAFAVQPHSCGPITFDGSTYASGTNGAFSPSSVPYPTSIATCPGYVFERWETSGGLSISGSNTTLTPSVRVTGNGKLTALFQPEMVIMIHFSSRGAGTVTIGGNTYFDGETDTLLPGNYPISVTPTPGNRLASLVLSAGLSLQGGSLNVSSSGTVTANFAPFPLLYFQVIPSSCPSLTFNGTPFANGENLSFNTGTYPAIAANCSGFSFSGWGASVGASVDNPTIPTANVTLSQNASLWANYSWIPVPTYTVTLTISPPSCGPITLNGSTVANGETVSLRTGHYLAVASRCQGEAFHSWAGLGGISVSNPDTFSVNFTVSGNGTLTASYVAILSASIAGTTNGNLSQPLSFTLSVQGGRSPYSINWRFGDGSTLSAPFTSPSETATHSYSAAGTYAMVAFVNDSSGQHVVANHTVHVVAPSSILPSISGGGGSGLWLWVVVGMILGVATLVTIVQAFLRGRSKWPLKKGGAGRPH